MTGYPIGARLTPLGFQQITDVSGSTALTVPKNAKMCIIDVTGQDVRWRDDGTAPTATVGMLIDISINPTLVYEGDPNLIRLIEVSSGAVLNVSYYG